MNITQLKYFHAVCTYKTVSAAAASLFVSQPTVSNALKELEEEFGARLFLRHYRSMVPTPEGEILFRMVSDLLDQADHIEHIMHDLGSGRKILRLGVPPMIGSLFLPSIYSDFAAQNDSVQLEILEGGKTELLNKLANDYLDMAFLSHDQPLDAAFSVQHVAQMETAFCVSKENPLAQLKQVSAADLTDVPLILFKNSYFQTEMIMNFFSEGKIIPRTLFQTEQLSSILSMISHNVAAGFLFKPLVEGNDKLVAIPTAKPLLTNVSLVRKKDGFFFNAMRSFADYVQENKHTFL